MSGQHPPQPPGNNNGRGWSPAPHYHPHHPHPPQPPPPPLLYRPPSPYTASPPPRLMGSPMSPMFGGRLPFMPCPRPRWAVPPPHHGRSPSPAGPRPFIPIPPHSPAASPIMCPSPEFYYSGISPYSELVGPPCHDYEYVGVPLEPPGPPRPPPLHIDGDDPHADGGMSTADIIACQSQDYIDEKLAEYQATIQQLQVMNLHEVLP